MLRKVLTFCAALYFVTLALLALFLYQASPGPRSQEIYGVRIGYPESYRGGFVHLSGRRLRCSDLADGEPYAAVCKVDIAGKTLEIRARRNPPPDSLDGVCEAFYDNQLWPCQIGSRHIHVGRFAFIEGSLGLDKAQLDVLRRTYFFENLPEAPFVRAIFILPVVTAALMMAVVCTWLWHGVRRKLVLIPAALVIGLASWVGSFFLTVFATNGFWD
ncbi:MAG: hypothetical protein JXA21_21595 [Anaerolineae bacterium]|nr:hypothetical protein [Anaerolineae bacterium]